MYRFAWFGLAEGVVADHRQSLTVVGFNLHAISIDVLPAPVPLVLLGLVEGDDEDPPLVPGQVATVGVLITAPSGAILAAGQQPMELAPSRWPDLSTHVQIVVGLGINVPQHGRYLTQMSVQLSDWPEPQVLERSLHMTPGD